MHYSHGRGSRVWDADNNEFIDYVLARGPLLLGHSPQPVLDAVRAQLDRGLMYAGQHELEIQAAERFCRLVPCADSVRFSCSGSEAVHAAVRLARAVTGRDKIIRFEGHYHGWFDNIFWNNALPADGAAPTAPPAPVPMSKGQPLTDAENLVIIPWNDPRSVQEAMKQHAGRIAAVITEPIMCNNGAILPQPGYLEELRESCTRHGALLIFDEIITGFRVSLGGAQEYFRVTPDLATFAKAMAGGFPVSAVAGKREYMQAFGDFSVTHAGTYNSNGPCMAATIAALDMLAADSAALLGRAHALGQRLMDGIRESAEKQGKPLRIRGVPAAFHVSFGGIERVIDFRSFNTRDREASWRFWEAMQERGIRTIPEGLWFVSTAHTQADVDATLAAVDQAMRVV